MNLKPMIALLGGKKNLKGDVTTAGELMDMMHAGFPFETVSVVAQKLQVEERILLELISTSSRTATRRLTERPRLKEDESDRLLRVVRLASQCEVIFGTIDKAAHWLQTPIRALRGRTPFSILDSDFGAAEVEDLLARIDEGIIS